MFLFYYSNFEKEMEEDIRESRLVHALIVKNVMQVKDESSGENS